MVVLYISDIRTGICEYLTTVEKTIFSHTCAAFYDMHHKLKIEEISQSKYLFDTLVPRDIPNASLTYNDHYKVMVWKIKNNFTVDRKEKKMD